MTQILIGALSGWKHHDRRQRCLSTWMADGDAVGVPSVFLLGCPTAAGPEVIGPHALALPCPDDYPSLPQRTRWFCKWAWGEDEGGRRKDEFEKFILHPSSFILWQLGLPFQVRRRHVREYSAAARLCDKDWRAEITSARGWREGVGMAAAGPAIC